MRIAAFVLGVLLLVPAAQAGAQQGASSRPDDGLREIRRLIDAHRYVEARAEIDRWWESAAEAAGREARTRALYLRARLAETAEAAERDYLRISIEHPQSPQADSALLRLGQARLAQGDPAVAAAYFRRLNDDYPDSPLRPEARAWLARTGEAGNSAGASAPTRSPAPGGERYTVQVAALGSAERAGEIRDELVAGGYEAYLVRVGSDPLTRVRVGAFPGAAPAREVAGRLRTAGYEAVVVEIGGR